MLKLEVRKGYMNASGTIVWITKHLNKEIFLATNGKSYLSNGRYHKDTESNYDLIAEIPKELHQHLINEVMNYWQDEDFRKTVNNVYGGEK